MSCAHITRAGKRAKLLEAAQGAARVPLTSVEQSEGGIGHDPGLEITGGCRGYGGLVGSRAALAMLVLQRQVEGQPGQMSCAGDLADAAQLQRAPILFHAPLGALYMERRDAQANLCLLFGRVRLRQRGNGQLFGLAIAAGPVKPPHRFGDQ